MSLDPVTLGLFAIAGGTVLSVAGQAAQAEAQAGAQEFSANVQEENAQIASAQAQEEANRIRTDRDRRIGRARAQYAASGVLTNTGSPLAILSDIAEEAELDALTVKYQGSLRSRDSRNQAAVDRAGASNTRTAGAISAGASLLSGGANFASTGRSLGAF